MKKEIKIEELCLEPKDCKDSGKRLTELINDRWEILTANDKIVILERDLPETSG